MIWRLYVKIKNINNENCNEVINPKVESSYPCRGASQVRLVVKNSPANTGDIRDTSSIPGSERSPERGHGNILQYSCLENPMDLRSLAGHNP